MHIYTYMYIYFTGTSSFAFVEFYESKDATRWMEKISVCLVQEGMPSSAVFCLNMYNIHVQKGSLVHEHAGFTNTQQ